MTNKKILEQLARYKEIIKAIKETYNLDSEGIAKKMNYNRAGTISEYGNINNYNEEKFQKFLELLHNFFGINVNYVLSGVGNIFENNPKDILKNMKDAINILSIQVNKLEDSINKNDNQLEYSKVTKQKKR